MGVWLHERALAWSVELLYPVGWYLNRVDISPQQLLHILWTIGPIYLVRRIDYQLETDWMREAHALSEKELTWTSTR